MTAAGTASAAGKWFTCSEGASLTKYETNQCIKAASGGKFQWNEVKGTESATGNGSLVLADTNVPVVGTVEVQCTGKTTGSIGPSNFSRVEKISEISCVAGKNCEKLEGNAEPRNLEGPPASPWQGEATEVEGTERSTITNGKTGTEAPGWAVKCRVLGVVKTDTCTSSTGNTTITNRIINAISSVLFTFDERSPNANCTIGGAGTGRVRGSILLTMATGLLFTRF